MFFPFVYTVILKQKKKENNFVTQLFSVSESLDLGWKITLSPTDSKVTDNWISLKSLITKPSFIRYLQTLGTTNITRFFKNRRPWNKLTRHTVCYLRYARDLFFDNRRNTRNTILSGNINTKSTPF